MPHAPEARVEAQVADPRPRGIETLPPCRERARVVVTAAIRFADAQTGLRERLLQCRIARQHAAGKYVLLDEIGLAAIVVESRFVNRDHLQRGGATGLQQRVQLTCISLPVCFTDGFEHFDRNDAIVAAGDITIIAVFDLRARREAGVADALPGVLELRV